MTLTLGSLFDGSGTAPLAAINHGITPVWASEIEPYPIRVTTKRFPQMRHLGNITEIDGASVPPVDIICGGSPCQDLSVAGKQAGLHNGERSHLFFEMTRVIKQMRGATNGKSPRFIIWENVPGAFSSNKGHDFHAVLQAFAEIADPYVHVPEPEVRGGRLAWKYAGEMVGDGWSIAWRTLDAQYWGVPQRRRRIYLVADFGSERAGDVLFECESVSRNLEPREEARKGTADNASGGTGGSDRLKCLNPWDSQTIRQYDTEGVYPALTNNSTGGQNRQGIVYPSVARTLTAEYDASPCIDRGQNVVAAFMGGQGAKARSVAYCDDGSTPTLKSAPSGGNTVPDVVYQNTGIGWWNESDVAETLRTPCGGDSTKANLAVFYLQGNCIDRNAQQNGCGIAENTAHTLNRTDRRGVSFAVDCRNLALNQELSATLQAKSNGGQSLNYQNPIVYSAKENDENI